MAQRMPKPSALPDDPKKEKPHAPVWSKRGWMRGETTPWDAIAARGGMTD